MIFDIDINLLIHFLVCFFCGKSLTVDELAIFLSSRFLGFRFDIFLLYLR